MSSLDSSLELTDAPATPARAAIGSRAWRAAAGWLLPLFGLLVWEALAHAGEVPEMNHNEIVAWAHRTPLAEKLAAILLRSEGEPPRIRARLDLTKRVISVHASVRECWSRGQSHMAQQMSLLYLGDFVSVYLAFLARKDPAEINAINFLKGELANLPM